VKLAQSVHSFRAYFYKINISIAMTHSLVGVLSHRFPTGSSAKIMYDFLADLPLDTSFFLVTWGGVRQSTWYVGH
jgi:hypothetical protein